MLDQVQEVKQATDIVSVIGERIHLLRAGKNYKALSPFRSEKSPSFFVSPDMQRYKDFGGGASGDVFTFLMEFDGLTFAEALQYCADRAGIKLQKASFTSEDVHRSRVREALDLAKEYYHYLLTKHKAGKQALEYVTNRGLTAETMQSFHIGYALDSWDALQKYLVDKKKYTLKELEDAGLCARNTSGRWYDRFRGRLMFPLTDAQGRVVGFSGRVLDPEVKEAKYINSPETMLYHKSELLFGFSVLKNLIRQQEEVFVMEGEFDVLSSYQAGVKNVVAIKGSAFTLQHMRVLARVAKKIILALDADSAGIEATKRAIEVAKDFEVSLRVLPLTGGKDPDQIAKEDPAEWRALSKKTVSVFEFLLDAAFSGKDMSTGDGVRAASVAVLPILFSISNAVEQAHYIQDVAKKLQVREEVVEEELHKYAQKQKLGVVATKVQPPQPTQPALSRIEAVERYVLTLLIHSPSKNVEAWLSSIQEQDWSTPSLQKIGMSLQKAVRSSNFNLKLFAAQLPAELQPLFADVYMEGEDLDPESAQKEWNVTRERWVESRKTQRLHEVAKAMKTFDDKAELTPQEEQQLKQLQRDFLELNQR